VETTIFPTTITAVYFSTIKKAKRKMDLTLQPAVMKTIPMQEDRNKNRNRD
jgi:hypothetical protein